MVAVNQADNRVSMTPHSNGHRQCVRCTRPLRVATLLAPPTAGALRVPATAGNDRLDILPAETVSQLRDPDVLLVDGVYSRAPEVRVEMDEYTVAHPHVAYVLIGSPSRRLAQVAIDAVDNGLSAVVLQGFDSASMVGATIRAAYVRRLPARVAWALTHVLDRVPISTARAVREALIGTISARRVADLAAAARVTLRTLYRHLAAAGIREPREIHRVARLLQTLPLVYGRGLPLGRVAERGGYHSYSHFQTHVREVLGWSPREVRYRVALAELLPRLVNTVSPGAWPHEEGAGAAVDAGPQQLVRAG